MVRILVAFLCLSMASAAKADELDQAAGHYKVARDSVIGFSVGMMGGGSISGSFPNFSGNFILDPNMTRSKVDFSLNANDITTPDPRIGEFIRSDAVFNAAQYPTITYQSTAVKRTGDRSAHIEGQLTARGLTRTVGFDVTFESRKGSTLRFHVTGKMSRALFKMDVGTPIYSNMVEFDMQMVGSRQ